MPSPRKAHYPVGKTFNLAGVPDSVVTMGYESHQHPNIPAPKPGYVFRRELLREVLNFLRNSAGDGLMVSGPTGSGKTSCITEVLSRLHWPCQQITAHARLELTDLIGQFKLVSAGPGQAPEMTFVYGVLPRAMKHGHVLLINEGDIADPSEMSGLNDIVEGRPLLIPETGEVIYPADMFRLIITGNSKGNGDVTGLHAGIQSQNVAFMDRFRMSWVGYLEPEEEMKLLEAALPILPEKIRAMLVQVANAVRIQYLGESGTGADGTLAITMSTRALVRWAKLAIDYREHPTPLKYALGISLTRKADPDDALAVEKIAEGILGDHWSGKHQK